jgi:hypothetical protein
VLLLRANFEGPYDGSYVFNCIMYICVNAFIFTIFVQFVYYVELGLQDFVVEDLLLHALACMLHHAFLWFSIAQCLAFVAHVTTRPDHSLI